MQGQEVNQCFEVLELPPEATLAEVKSSYQHLRDLYSSGDSIVTYPLSEELPEAERKAILGRIEEAYRRLLEHFERGGGQQALPSVAGDLRSEIAAISSFSGDTLRWIRERLGLDLGDISLATKIHKQYLSNIETEKFSTLPPAVYVRGYVCAYARYLCLDEKKVADDFMSRYNASQDGP